MKKRYFLASLALHALLLGGIALKSGGGSGDSDKGEKQAGTGQEDLGNIVEKPQDKIVEVDLIPAEQIESAVQKPKKKQSRTQECKGFGGIGVQYSSFNGIIDSVIPGYPAYRAGIEPGDQIVSPGISEIRGEVGTSVDLVIVRGSYVLEVTLIRELICTDGGKRE